MNNGNKYEIVYLNKNIPDNKKSDELLHWCKEFYDLGIVPGSAGNLSFRTQNGFIITATGAELQNISNKELVEVFNVKRNSNRIKIYVKGLVDPSKETLMHQGIYNLYSNINAVFHGHDENVLKNMNLLSVPSTEIERPRGSCALAKEVVKLLNRKDNIDYFILKNHGIISLGKTMTQAGERAKFFNKSAKENQGQKKGE